MTDYRESHIDKGATYDDGVATDPWDSYMHHWEARHLRRIVPRLFPRGVPRYLDFACGTGRITAIVSAMASDSTGVDVSPSMLEVAKKKVPGARFIQADLTRDSLAMSEFDLITAFRFFGNAQPDLRRASLRALNGSQAIGGYLISNNHRNPNSLANMIHRMRGGSSPMDLTYHRFRGILSAAGYQITEVAPIGAWKFRGKLSRAIDVHEKGADRLERLFSGRPFAAIAPDAVIVARKVRACDG